MIYLFFLWSISKTSAQSEWEKLLKRANKHLQDAERYYIEMDYNKAKESYQFAAK